MHLRFCVLVEGLASLQHVYDGEQEPTRLQYSGCCFDQSERGTERARGLLGAGRAGWLQSGAAAGSRAQALVAGGRAAACNADSVLLSLSCRVPCGLICPLADLLNVFGVYVHFEKSEAHLLNGACTHARTHCARVQAGGCVAGRAGWLLLRCGQGVQSSLCAQGVEGACT